MCFHCIDVTDGVALLCDIGRKSKVFDGPSGSFVSDSIDINRSAQADGPFDALRLSPDACANRLMNNPRLVLRKLFILG